MNNRYYVEIRGTGSAVAQKDELLEALTRGISERGTVEDASVVVLAGRPTVRFNFRATSQSEAESLVSRALFHARDFSVDAGVVLLMSESRG